jgi:hypothetical protein
MSTANVFLKDNHEMPDAPLTDTLTAIAYRLATYLVNNVIDDPAMLSIIFC